MSALGSWFLVPASDLSVFVVKGPHLDAEGVRHK
ncbi:hypothetical protein FVEG_05649 [Fusarium verticillioides 7600]|uniref:Uncharacterized protein n=1 Tax=Gibberella moniliformis (strain M3125 / FGSC 7600) TaxID=334819 RepID=W7MAX5_GIBM7|nr:hypothetical protein FVEG_05649 [Fusarium verticillioides 7600]EWG44639.1 hypothetical protein FVEG_05649 [Fusarium verticillioides 7600]